MGNVIKGEPFERGQRLNWTYDGEPATESTYLFRGVMEWSADHTSMSSPDEELHSYVVEHEVTGVLYRESAFRFAKYVAASTVSTSPGVVRMATTEERLDQMQIEIDSAHKLIKFLREFIGV